MTGYIVSSIPEQHCSSCGAHTVDGRVAQPNSYVTTDVTRVRPADSRRR